MLDPREAATVAEQFGVSDEQGRRDHLISHLLAVLGQRLADRVVFFGGTALARTHLRTGDCPKISICSLSTVGRMSRRRSSSPWRSGSAGSTGT
jgi:hypothetical protein